MNQIEELIHRRRRQVLLHSYLYYQMNTNIISDHTYDYWCKELAELQRDYPEESKNVSFYFKEFSDFDGSTGCDLPQEPWMHEKCNRLLNYHKKLNKF
jgi:hypothetical protein